MTRFKIIITMLLALFTFGAMVTAAGAVEGFLPLTKKGVTFLGKKTILEFTGAIKLSCAALSGNGTFTSDSHGEAVLNFEQCETGGFPEFSLGDVEPKTVKEALVLVPILFLICLITSATLSFGVWIELTEPVHAHTKALDVLDVTTGSFIGAILTSATTKLFVVDFTQTKGVQSVTQCKDESGNTKKALLLSKQCPEASQQAGLQVTEGLLEFQEAEDTMDT
jgi:hypothetical protein